MKKLQLYLIPFAIIIYYYFAKKKIQHLNGDVKPQPLTDEIILDNSISDIEDSYMEVFIKPIKQITKVPLHPIGKIKPIRYNGVKPQPITDEIIVDNSISDIEDSYTEEITQVLIGTINDETTNDSILDIIKDELLSSSESDILNNQEVILDEVDFVSDSYNNSFDDNFHMDNSGKIQRFGDLPPDFSDGFFDDQPIYTTGGLKPFEEDNSTNESQNINTKKNKLNLINQITK